MEDWRDYVERRRLGVTTRIVLSYREDRLVLKEPQLRVPYKSAASSARLLARAAYRAIVHPEHLGERRNWGILHRIVLANPDFLWRKDVWPSVKGESWREVVMTREHAAAGFPVLKASGVVKDRSRAVEYVCERCLQCLGDVALGARANGDRDVLAWAERAWASAIETLKRKSVWGDIRMAHALVSEGRVLFTDAFLKPDESMDKIVRRQVEDFEQVLNWPGYNPLDFNDALNFFESREWKSR